MPQAAAPAWFLGGLEELWCSREEESSQRAQSQPRCYFPPPRLRCRCGAALCLCRRLISQSRGRCRQVALGNRRQRCGTHLLLRDAPGGTGTQRRASAALLCGVMGREKRKGQRAEPCTVRRRGDKRESFSSPVLESVIFLSIGCFFSFRRPVWHVIAAP